MTIKGTETPARQSMTLHRRISRGLLRFWAVASVPWIVAVVLLYEPTNSISGVCRGYGFYPYPYCLSLGMVMDSIPIELPQARGDTPDEVDAILRKRYPDLFEQRGIRFDDLTLPQKWLVGAWNNAIADELAANPSVSERDRYDARFHAIHYLHSNSLYKLVPVAELSAADAARFRRVWVDPLRARFSDAVWDLAELALGLPLLVLVAGAIVLHAARWVWGGFRAGA